MGQRLSPSGQQAASALIHTGSGGLAGLVLTTAAAAATITVYDNTTAAGTVIGELKCVTANHSKSIMFGTPIAYSTGLYVALTGVGATFHVIMDKDT